MLKTLLLMAALVAAVPVFGQSYAYLNIPFNRSGASAPAWSSSVPYGQGSVVNRNGLIYFSLTLGNRGNDPATTPQQWMWAGMGSLPLAGGTLTGPLYLQANPTSALQAATKQYVDNAVSNVQGSGGGNAGMAASGSYNILNSGTGRVDGVNRTMIFGGTTASNPCAWYGGNCSTAGDDTLTSIFDSEGQNVPGSRTIYDGGMGDGMRETYCNASGGDDMTNQEGKCGDQSFMQELNHTSQFYISDSAGTGLTTIHQPVNEVGVGRILAPVASAWSGSVNSGGMNGGEPFAQANLQGRTDAAGVMAQFGAQTAQGATSIQIATSSSFGRAVTSTSSFSAGALVCIAESGLTHRYFEIQQIQSVTDSTHLALTQGMHYPHSGSAIVASGGLCGYGIEQTANTAASGRDGAIQVWPIMTSIDANGTVEYANGLDGAMVATAGNTAWASTNNGANLYRIAVTYSYDPSSLAYTVSPNQIAWAPGTQMMSPHGLDPSIYGFRIYADQNTPGRDNGIALGISATRWHASHPTDRALDISMGGALIPGVQPLAEVWLNGGAGYAFHTVIGLGGFFTDDTSARGANGTTTTNLWSFAGANFQHITGNNSAGFAFTGDFLNLPSGTYLVYDRYHGVGWSYNPGGPQYVGISNAAHSGGQGNGDTWLSIDGATVGDGLGNLQAHGLQIPAQKATSGSRYACFDTNGNLFSSATACSGQ